ncbi:type II toxin-antitoxin system PemK/MazF family toxin [Candidatus Parcubacteria bacterium]|nr:MAG: type II toxin-antitoxin system PemK/MazF family toxin [Candidatus Parcubacteria bacterium]
MSRGDIVLIPFPFTDLSGQKVRPALVLHNEKKGEDCVVIFLSSIKQKKIMDFDVPVKPSSQNGLKIFSTIKVNKIATLQKKIVIGELGSLEDQHMEKVNNKLKQLFGF